MIPEEIHKRVMLEFRRTANCVIRNYEELCALRENQCELQFPSIKAITSRVSC